MRTCLSHGGLTLVQAAEPPREVHVGSLRGVATLTRGQAGSAWNLAPNRQLAEYHVSALTIGPISGTLFAGTHGGGVFASEDDGKSWEQRSTGITQLDVYSIAATALGGSERIYAGTEPAHLFESEDQGCTWRELSALRDLDTSRWMFPAPPHVAHVKNINFDPRDPGVLLVGIEVGGLYKSTDRGASFVELAGVYQDVHRVVTPPSNPDRMFVTGGDGIYLSPDGGKQWEHLTDRSMRVGYPDALLIHPTDENLMFTAGAFASPRHWAEAGTANPRIARSRDQGRTWEVLNQGLPDQIHGNIECLSMYVHPTGFSIFAATTDGDVFLSEDGGDSWATIATGLPAISKGGHYRFDNVPDREVAQAAAGR